MRACFVAFAVTVVACGGSGGGGGGGGGGGTTLTLTQLCSGVGDALAAQVQTCLKATPDALAAVKSSFSSDTCDQLGRAVTANRATYDAGKAAACLSAIQAMTCTSPEISLQTSACAGVIAGTVATGGTCYTDLDCTSGTCDWSTTCPGKCIAYLASGASCGAVGPDFAECGPGLGCEMTSSTCKIQSDAGGPCPCKAGTYCDSSNVCRAVKTSGSCSSDGECAFGYVCAGSSCTAYVVPGASCAPNASACGLGAYCDATTSKCVAWPKIGESCAAYPLCFTGYCDSATKTCTAPLANGAACTSSSQCQSTSYCDATCKPSKANGAACATSDECASYDCNNGVCVASICTEP